MTTQALPDTSLVPARDKPYRVDGYYQKVIDGCREEIVIAFHDSAVSFRADPDTDSLETHFLENTFEPTPDYQSLNGTPLDRFLGREWGWSWLATNQQGYTDSALISFDGIVPNLLLHVSGSVVGVMAIDSKMN